MAIGQHRSVIAADRTLLINLRFLIKVEQVGVILCTALFCASLDDRKEENALILSVCKLEATNYDFIQVVLGVCPEPLREYMRIDKDYMARIVKVKDLYDGKRCKQEKRDESTEPSLTAEVNLFPNPHSS